MAQRIIGHHVVERRHLRRMARMPGMGIVVVVVPMPVGGGHRVADVPGHRLAGAVATASFRSSAVVRRRCDLRVV